MKPTEKLHALGQSLWLDNITPAMLNDGTMQTYIDEFSVTGLTSNPTIFLHAIGGGHAYDGDIKAAPSELETEALCRRPDQCDAALFRCPDDRRRQRDHGRVGQGIPADGGDCDVVIARFEAAGIDIDVLAERLQIEGARAFVKSRQSLLHGIEAKRTGGLT